MLRRQQASAIIAARQKIVDGAVGMVEMALELLSPKQIVHLDEERKAAMVSNLLVVLCSERGTQPGGQRRHAVPRERDHGGAEAVPASDRPASCYEALQRWAADELPQPQRADRVPAARGGEAGGAGGEGDEAEQLTPPCSLRGASASE